MRIIRLIVAILLLHQSNISLAQAPEVKKISTSLGNYYGGVFNDYVRTSDSNIVFAGWNQYCDIGFRSYPNAIYNKFIETNECFAGNTSNGSLISFNPRTRQFNQGRVNCELDGKYYGIAEINQSLIAIGTFTGDWSPNKYDLTIRKFPLNYSSVDCSNPPQSIKYGGSYNDGGYSMVKTKQSELWIAGFAYSNDGDITTNKGETDVWVVKIDSSLNLLKSLTFGGSSFDTAYAIEECPGGFIIAGTSSSSDGDLTGNFGQQDGWVIKLDTEGNIVWQKNFGGTGFDVLNSVTYDSTDQSLVFSGYSTSNNNQLNGNHGARDLWVLKTDLNGNMIWSKLYGGSADEAAFTIMNNISANGYYVSGFTESKDGDIRFSYNQQDAWTIAIDKNGHLIWEKTVGSKDREFAMMQFNDENGDITVAGFKEVKLEGEYSPQSTYCYLTVYNLGLGNSIQSFSFKDVNYNNIWDIGEAPFSDLTITAYSRKDSNVATPVDGKAYLVVDTGHFQIKVNTHRPYYTIIPGSYEKHLPNYYNRDSVYFAIQPIQGKQDMAVQVQALTAARPGFDAQYKISFSNVGNTSVNPLVELILDPRLQFKASLPVYTTKVADTLRWQLLNIAPDSTASFIINTTVSLPNATQIGDTLKLTATISPLDIDNNPADNRFTLKQVVRGSYDPNDKQEAYGGKITEEQMTQNNRVYYTIRFQNTGTDTAFNVVLRDTLSAKLNPASLQILGASHDYRMQVASGNQLSFYFDNILLPDSNRNKLGSNGYVSFSISPYAVPKAGDTIRNKAAIYFDFNLPVITNTSQLLITKVQGSTCAGSDVLFNAGYPNATNWQWQEEVEEGAGFVNISNNALYSGTASNQLRVIAPATNTTGYRYRCLLTVNGKQISSEIFTLRFVNQWKGTVSTAWELATNWSCGQVPDTNSDVFIPLNTPFRPEISVSTQVRKATVEAGSLLSVKSGVVFIIGNAGQPN